MINYYYATSVTLPRAKFSFVTYLCVLKRHNCGFAQLCYQSAESSVIKQQINQYINI